MTDLQQIVAAVLARKSAVVGDVTVIRFAGLGDTDVYLRGDCIATVRDRADAIEWYAPTEHAAEIVRALLGCLVRIGVPVPPISGHLPLEGEYNRENREAMARAQAANEERLRALGVPYLGTDGRLHARS